jgi:hypothetical protein
LVSALVEVKRILFKRPVNRKSALAAIALHAGRHEQNRICGTIGLAQSAWYRD